VSSPLQSTASQDAEKYGSLAYAEIYITLAELFGRFNMKLFETERGDIDQVHDFFSPFPDSEKGLRVNIE
jgi:hypothetical protein